MSQIACTRCSSRLRPGRTFTFSTPGGEVFKCLACALIHSPMVRRSFLTAIVVGTILSLLNQGTIFLTGSWESGLYWKIPLTYCVPFIVATWGALSNGRR